MPLKRTPGDLAINGGTPAFQEPLHVGRPNIGSKEGFKHRIDDMFERRWLTNDGPYVQELERLLQEHLQVEHCVLVNNGTMGAMIAAKAMGLTGSVILPAFTFVATAHAMAWLGLRPVFCDIDPKTHNIDPAAVERLITAETSAIFGVHCWGRPCDNDGLSSLAKHYGLRLMYDAAHAFSCSCNGAMIGNFGDAEVFSFHATKFFNTFEGGAITTNDPELAQKIRLMRNFGFAGYDEVACLGINGKMPEISAAMGLTNLANLETFIKHNRANYLAYRESLSNTNGLSIIEYDPKERNNYQYVILEINESICGVTRDQLHTTLQAENVLARRYFYPGCHQMPPYAPVETNKGDPTVVLPNTDRLCRSVLSLPTGTAITPLEIDTIGSIIATCVRC